MKKVLSNRWTKVVLFVLCLVPLAWLVSVTFTAAWHKMFDPNPRIGFLAHARQLAASAAPNPAVSRLIFNDRLDALVTATLMFLVALVLLESIFLCGRVLSGRREARVREAPFVPTRFAAEEQG